VKILSTQRIANKGGNAETVDAKTGRPRRRKTRRRAELEPLPMNLILSENASASSVFAVEEARFPILPRIFGRSERRAVDERPATSGETNAKPGRTSRRRRN